MSLSATRMRLTGWVLSLRWPSAVASSPTPSGGPSAKALVTGPATRAAITSRSPEASKFCSRVMGSGWLFCEAASISIDCVPVEIKGVRLVAAPSRARMTPAERRLICCNWPVITSSAARRSLGRPIQAM